MKTSKVKFNKRLATFLNKKKKVWGTIDWSIIYCSGENRASWTFMKIVWNITIKPSFEKETLKINYPKVCSEHTHSHSYPWPLLHQPSRHPLPIICGNEVKHSLYVTRFATAGNKFHYLVDIYWGKGENLIDKVRHNASPCAPWG